MNVNTSTSVISCLGIRRMLCAVWDAERRLGCTYAGFHEIFITSLGLHCCALLAWRYTHPSGHTLMMRDRKESHRYRHIVQRAKLKSLYHNFSHQSSTVSDDNAQRTSLLNATVCEKERKRFERWKQHIWRLNYGKYSLSRWLISDVSLQEWEVLGM